jgi:DNA-directed RNA polymerase subunit RPC12/RpoP
MKYICGHCKKTITDHLVRALDCHPRGVARCPSCGSLNAVRTPSLTGLVPVAGLGLLLFLLDNVLSLQGAASWLWLIVKVALLGTALHFSFLRVKLTVVAPGPGT